jgi:hypothetical protein
VFPGDGGKKREMKKKLEEEGKKLNGKLKAKIGANGQDVKLFAIRRDISSAQ